MAQAQSEPSALPDAVAAIMGKPRYAQATWSLLVADVASGEPLYALRPDDLAFTGSVRKLFSVGPGPRSSGAGQPGRPPRCTAGAGSTGGALTGDLVLVGAGDLTFGGRRNADGTVAVTDFDHNDANNLGTALLTPQDPLAGLDALARQVAASGIRAVTGDVVVDDRLFEPYRVPNQQPADHPGDGEREHGGRHRHPHLAGAPGAAWTGAPRRGPFAVDRRGAPPGPPGTEDSVSLSGDGPDRLRRQRRLHRDAGRGDPPRLPGAPLGEPDRWCRPSGSRTRRPSPAPPSSRPSAGPASPSAAPAGGAQPARPAPGAGGLHRRDARRRLRSAPYARARPADPEGQPQPRGEPEPVALRPGRRASRRSPGRWRRSARR